MLGEGGGTQPTSTGLNVSRLDKKQKSALNPQESTMDRVKRPYFLAVVNWASLLRTVLILFRSKKKKTFGFVIVIVFCKKQFNTSYAAKENNLFFFPA